MFVTNKCTSLPLTSYLVFYDMPSIYLLMQCKFWDVKLDIHKMEDKQPFTEHHPHTFTTATQLVCQFKPTTYLSFVGVLHNCILDGILVSNLEVERPWRLDKNGCAWKKWLGGAKRKTLLMNMSHVVISSPLHGCHMWQKRGIMVVKWRKEINIWKNNKIKPTSLTSRFWQIMSTYTSQLW